MRPFLAAYLGGRDPVAVRRLQHLREVRGAPRPGPPPVRLRGRRDRPLRPPRRGRRGESPAAPGPRSRQGPDLLPVRAPPGPARPRPVPARRAAPSPRSGRWPARSGWRRPTSPRARRSASSRAATTATRSGREPPGRRSRDRSSTPTAPGSASTAARPATRSASDAGSGVALGEPRYVSRIDAATNTIVLGRRADLETSTVALDDVSFVAGTPPAGSAAPFRAAVRIRHRAVPVPATVRPATER